MIKLLTMTLAASLCCGVAFAQSSPTLPSATIPGTGGKAVVSPKTPEAGNPGKQITVSPGTITTPGDNRTQPSTAPGVFVTVPLGTIEKKK